MTRSGFLLFNVLLTVFIYCLVYKSGGTRLAAMRFILWNYSEPTFVLILFMLLFSTIRWFMNHNEEVGREIMTWVHMLWLMPVATLLMIYWLGGIEGNFWHGLRGLTTLR